MAISNEAESKTLIKMNKQIHKYEVDQWAEERKGIASAYICDAATGYRVDTAYENLETNEITTHSGRSFESYLNEMIEVEVDPDPYPNKATGLASRR